MNCKRATLGVSGFGLPLYFLVICFLFACSKKPAPTPPGPAPEKDYGSEDAMIADGSRGRDLSEMGFQKSRVAGVEFSSILFGLNEVTPLASSLETLHTLVDEAPKYKACRIEGHACPLGDTQYNEALGYHRAQAVLAYLRAAGVRTGFQVISYGEERPVTHELFEYNLNRRVVVECSK